MFEKQQNHQTVIFKESEKANGIDSSVFLPKDLTETANERLGLLALALSAVGIVSYLYHYLISILIHDQGTPFQPNFPILIIIVLSLLIAFTTKQRLFRTSTLHSIGIVYVILTALLIIISHTATEWWVSRDRLQGVSWVCVWIVLFPIVVPSSTLKAILIAISMAFMGPVGLFIATSFLGKAAATMTAYLDLFIPNLISAAMAVFISCVIVKLSKDVQSARMMGSYKLEHKLGQGGMGEVWQATHRMLARPAAIKLIHPEILELDELQAKEAKERLFYEANITSSLTSPYTVELYDFGITDDNTFYFVMELLNGDDLNWLTKRNGPMPANRVVYLLIQLCESLAEAHDAGLIHRDIKPANIFICHIGLKYDFVKVLDFGIARNLTEDQQTIEVEGTPGFMAPEALKDNKKITSSVDIYAVGCVAYWMLTTKNVFGLNLDIPLTNHKTNLNLKNPIPSDLDQLIRDCLSEAPDNRPQSAKILAEKLSGCDVGEVWTNDMAKDWWENQTYKKTDKTPVEIDPDAITEIRHEKV